MSEPRRDPPAPGTTSPATGGTVRTPIFGLLDSIRSAWNVGSMFRTADAAGLAGLYLCGLTATPPRRDIEKTALGATLSVPWDYWEDAAAAVEHLRGRGVAVIALEQTPAARPHDDLPCGFPVCFVVGHELRGVSPAVLERVDGVAEIGMAGVKKSLNVAVSFGVMAYELRRRWLESGGAPTGTPAGDGRTAAEPSRGRPASGGRSP
jgi:tRNA G18 (ribose-2'-O)-methylase SpoU